MARIHHFPLAAILALCTACAVPHPAFMGAEKQVVEVEGSRFTIYRRDAWVEVYRTSVEALPDRAVIHARAHKAIRIATGCTVAEGTFEGDQALMRAGLDCRDGTVPPSAPAPDVGFSCEVVDGWTIQSRNTDVAAIECTAE